MAEVYNKLVRDKIPQIITGQGDCPKTLRLSDEDYFTALNTKLMEEVDEYLDEFDIRELADVLEVVYAIAAYKGISAYDLERIRRQKHQERGGFDERTVLLEVQRQSK